MASGQASKEAITAIASAAKQQTELKPDAKLACFTFILEGRNGYVAEGFYPNVTPQQYKIIVAALEGKFDEEPPRIFVPA
jgi:hypothetical protein